MTIMMNCTDQRHAPPFNANGPLDLVNCMLTITICWTDAGHVPQKKFRELPLHALIVYHAYSWLHSDPSLAKGNCNGTC